ncbi:MAG: hypothetical protein QW650_07920 [Thermofilum sp.]
MSVSELSRRAQSLLEITAEADRLFGYLGEALAGALELANTDKFIECHGSQFASYLRDLIGAFESISDEYAEVRDRAHSVWRELSGAIESRAFTRSAAVGKQIKITHECIELWNEYRVRLTEISENAAALASSVNHLGAEAWAIIRAMREAGVLNKPGMRSVVEGLREVADMSGRIVQDLNTFMSRLLAGPGGFKKQSGASVEEGYNALVSLFMSIRSYVEDMISNVGEIGELIGRYDELYVKSMRAWCRFDRDADFLRGTYKLFENRGIHHAWEIRKIRQDLMRFENAVSRLRSEVVSGAVGKQDECAEIGGEMISVLRQIIEAADLAIANAQMVLGIDEKEQFRRAEEIARQLSDRMPGTATMIEMGLYLLINVRDDVSTLSESVLDVRESAEALIEVLSRLIGR